jgi:hypothetical protein
MLPYSNPLALQAWLQDELDRIEERIDVVGRRSSAAEGDVYERVIDAEIHIGRLTLVLRALVEACVRRGLIEKRDLTQLIDSIDRADGVADGQLDPALLQERLAAPSSGTAATPRTPVPKKSAAKQAKSKKAARPPKRRR